MGERLVRFFEEAEQFGGISAKVLLASLTRVTSTEAASVPDTAVLEAQFQAAMAKVRARHHGSRGAIAQEFDRTEEGPADARMLRRHVRAYLDLMSQRALVLGDVLETCRRVNEAAANTLDVARVSVWLFDDTASKIECIDLYEKDHALHSDGMALAASDYAPYFRALQFERTIAAHDAHTDPRTSCFSESYLTPLGIGAMLDVPIWVGDRMVGVICHEHVGARRQWSADEETFAYLMSNFVALAFEARDRTTSAA